MIARRELLLLPESMREESLNRAFNNKKEYERLVKRTISIDGEIDNDETRNLVRAFSCLTGHDLRELWPRWLRSESVFLQLLVPRVLAACTRPAVEDCLSVLSAGISYPDPSHNRFFIQAAIRHLGLCRVLEVLEERSENASRAQLQEIAAAYYWAYYDPKHLSGRCPPDHDSRAEKVLRKKLRKRLRKVAKYLRRWWDAW